MEDETSRLVNKVQELGDIELAVLLCLIAQEHCIIEADEEELDNVEQELGLVRVGIRCVESHLMRPRLPIIPLGFHMPSSTALRTPPWMNLVAVF
jgi:hypothetical protein